MYAFCVQRMKHKLPEEDQEGRTTFFNPTPCRLILSLGFARFT